LTPLIVLVSSNQNLFDCSRTFGEVPDPPPAVVVVVGAAVVVNEVPPPLFQPWISSKVNTELAPNVLCRNERELWVPPVMKSPFHVTHHAQLTPCDSI
jgi:hypothetical protein